MSTTVREDLLRAVPRTDDPEIRARQRHVAEVLLDLDPEFKQSLIDQGLQPLVHLFERRLARRLTDGEHRDIHTQLRRLGAARLGDVVLDLSTEALATWLASADADP